MKSKNILQMLENQIDKIVLAIYVLISLFLLWVYVIGNPYKQQVRITGRERNLNSGQIDSFIKDEAVKAASQLDSPPPPTPSEKAHFPEYNRLTQCPISEISSAVYFPAPGVGDTEIQGDRLYALPEIPALTDVGLASLRGAARIPTEAVGPDQAYDRTPHETGDVDLITVSAEFDVQSLYNNFQQSFMGPRLKTSEKDPRLAKPVFAQMDLQRRQKQDDDRWGSWERVSRTRIDSYQKLLQDLPMKLDQSKFDVGFWMTQFQNENIQRDILQPESYLFSVSRLEWMAPEFLIEASGVLDKEEAKAEREALEERRERRESTTGRSTDTRRTTNRRPTNNRRQPQQRRGGGGDMMMGQMGGERRPGTTARRPERKERTVEDVKKDFEKELLDENSTIASLRDPLLVWAHDDSVEPGNVYQYRIRIGVFNPIAGKDWLESEKAEFKNQLVLWSEYSQPTDELDVPKRIYLFPIEVIAAKDASDSAEGVRVEIAKYHLGKWRDFDFDVYPGEIMGYENEDIEEERGGANAMGEFETMAAMPGMNQDDNKVDFTTGNMLVDVSTETIWGSRLRPSSLNTMLYYDVDNQMQQMAVGKNNWHPSTRKRYADIQKKINQDVQRRGGPGMMPGDMMPGDMMDPMMMEMMMMEGG